MKWRASGLSRNSGAAPEVSVEKWKIPPPIKVYEALGAVGDGRVRAIDGARVGAIDGARARAINHDAPPARWEVASSDAAKTYSVEISADGRELSSNDNASYWQGYLGYPGIAVLIARGALPASAEATRALAGIPWKELNRRFKNAYTRTTAEVARFVAERGGDFEAIRAEATAILEALADLAPERGARRRPPRERKASH